MRNIKYYQKDCIEFHKTVVNRKKATKSDSTLKDRLINLENDINRYYEIYKRNFKRNCLEQTTPNILNEENKNDLLSLYNFKSKLIQELKREITTTETNRIINTCPNCTLSEINSFDHILPKEEFSEFVINPLNLFPSCTKCNNHKGKFWIKDDKKIFLNLYLDELPQQQYLFVDIKYENNTFVLEFKLENNNGIDIELFSLIESHYNKLQLLQRFSDNADLVITPLKNNIIPYLNKLDFEDIKSNVIETAELNKGAFGYNYWKSILEISLINNKRFIDTLY